MTDPKTIKARVEDQIESGTSLSIMGAVFAFIISAAASLGYGAAAAFLPVVLVDLIFLFIAAIFVFHVFARTGASRLARLMVAIPGGLLCLVMMWLGWLWMKTGHILAVAMLLLTVDPVQDLEALLAITGDSGDIMLAGRFSYIALLGFPVSVVVGSGLIKLFWVLESLMFLLLPIMGAWRGAGDDKQIDVAAAR